MMPRFLAKDAATSRSISLTFLPMRKPLGPARSTATTASISSSSCTLPEYSTRFMRGSLSEERGARGFGRNLVERCCDLAHCRTVLCCKGRKFDEIEAVYTRRVLGEDLAQIRLIPADE